MKVIKKCEYCGREFIATNGMTKYCNDQHFGTCVICGKKFPVKKDNLSEKCRPKTCSRQCSKILQNLTYKERTGYDNPMQNPEVKQKIGETNLERYGVRHAAQAEEIKEKTRLTSRERYGCDYYLQTDEFREASEKTCLKKYGVSKIGQAKQVRDKIDDTCIERYGSRSCFGNAEIRKKAAATYESRTGYALPQQDPAVQESISETNRVRYGVNRPMQSEDIQAKAIKHNLEVWGAENPMQSAQIREKSRQTWLENYGVDNPMKSPEIRDRNAASFRSKHGVDYYMQTRDAKLNIIHDPSKVDNLIEFRSDPYSFVAKNFPNRLPSLKELNMILGTTSADQIIKDLGCDDLVRYVRSYYEQGIVDLLNILSVNFKTNDHFQIRPYELDFYLDDHKFAIECDPTVTHNSSISDPWGADPKSPSYHKMKTDMCEDRGIFLFHIFGYEWTHKREIIESMIKNILGKCDQKIYARKCVVKEVDSNTATKFLNANHRQGAAGASVRLGLYYQGELVSLMTFGKMRNTIGTSKNEDLSDCWELVRFCSKLNTSVVGGASKLFKYFVRAYNPVRIRSFSDRAHTRGTLYQKLGFTELRRSDPGYVWVDLYTDRAYNRYNTQKQNIKKFLHDDTLDLSKSEKQIMEEHDFVQVFDCGTITWEWLRI